MSEQTKTLPATTSKQENRIRLGGLWKKTNEHGSFLSGLIELDGKTRRIVVSRAKLKNTVNSPDYNVFEMLELGTKPEPKAPEVVDMTVDDGIL